MRIRLTKLFYVIILVSGMHPLTAQQNCEVQLQAKENTIKRLESQVEEKKAKIGKDSIENSQLKDSIAVLRQKGSEAIKAHEAALENLRNEHTEKLSNKNEESNRQKEQIVSLEEKLEREREQCKPLKSKIKELRSEIEGNQATIARLKSEKTTLNNEKKELQSEVEDLERKNRELVNNNGDLETTKKQLLDKQKQNQEEIRNLNQIIRQKDNAIAQLEPIKRKILNEIKSGVEGLYEKLPENGEVEFSGLESRFSLALSFKDSTDVMELKKKFHAYKQQVAYIKKAEKVLEGKYSLQDILSAQSNISKVTIPVFQQEKQRLTRDLQGYCKANNEIVNIFETVHKFGNKNTRTTVLQNSLQAIKFDLESYPFLYNQAKEKQRDITANNIPGDLKKETCPN